MWTPELSPWQTLLKRVRQNVRGDACHRSADPASLTLAGWLQTPPALHEKAIARRGAHVNWLSGKLIDPQIQVNCMLANKD
jgi:hypothetical protein